MPSKVIWFTIDTLKSQLSFVSTFPALWSPGYSSAYMTVWVIGELLLFSESPAKAYIGQVTKPVYEAMFEVVSIANGERHHDK